MKFIEEIWEGAITDKQVLAMADNPPPERKASKLFVCEQCGSEYTELPDLCPNCKKCSNFTLHSNADRGDAWVRRNKKTDKYVG